MVHRVNGKAIFLDDRVVGAQDGGYFGEAAGFEGIGCYGAYAAAAD